MAKSASALPAREIAWRRLANQHLITPLAAPLDVVRSLGAVQSQDYAGGKWGIGQRTRGVTDADIERELTKGTIVRTHILRPTWHFVAAEDIRWMLALTAPRVRTRMDPYDRKLELDDKVYAKSAAAITRALSQDKELTRPELRQVLERARIGVMDTQRLAHVMMRAELDGLVCSGVLRGKQSTYALLEERLPPARMMDPDEALAELARRYFTTRGPATAQDFSWWSGLRVGDAKRGVEAIQSQLEHRVVDGKTYWFTGSAPPTKSVTSIAHLLPNYDEYFIGLKDRSAIGELVKERVVGLPGDTFFANIVTVGGQLVGGWTRTVTPRKLSLQIWIVAEVTRAQLRSIDAQAKRYGEFLRIPVVIEITRGRQPGIIARKRTK